MSDNNYKYRIETFKALANDSTERTGMIVLTDFIVPSTDMPLIAANDPNRNRRLVQRTNIDGNGDLIKANICCYDQARWIDYLNHTDIKRNLWSLKWKTEIITDPEILKTAQCYCGLCVEERTGIKQ